MKNNAINGGNSNPKENGNNMKDALLKMLN